MKTFFTFYALLCLGYIVSSQNTNTTYIDAQQIKDRTLLLILPEPKKMVINDLEQEDSSFVQIYKDDIDGQRMALQNAVSKYWSFSDTVIVVTAKEAKTRQKKDPMRYAVMKIGENKQDRAYIYSQPQPPMAAWVKSRGRLIYNYSMRYNLQMLGLTTLVIEVAKNKVAEVYLPKMSPSEGDFITAVNQISYLLGYVSQTADHTSNKLLHSIENASPLLTDKILLLDSRELGCTYDEIRSVYPYPFKIVSCEDIDAVIKKKDSQYVIITAPRTDEHRTTYILSNAGDGTLYSSFTEESFSEAYGEQKGYAIAVHYLALKPMHIRRLGKG